LFRQESLTSSYNSQMHSKKRFMLSSNWYKTHKPKQAKNILKSKSNMGSGMVASLVSKYRYTRLKTSEGKNEEKKVQ